MDQIPFQLPERGRRRGRFGVDHQIQWPKIFALRPSPIDLPKSSFEFDSNNCTADPPAHSQADARMAASIVNKIKRCVRSVVSPAFLIAAAVILAATKPLRPRQRLPGASNLSLARHRTRQLGAPGLCGGAATRSLGLGAFAYAIESHVSSCGAYSWADMCVSRSFPGGCRLVPLTTPVRLTTLAGSGQRRRNLET